MYGKRVADLWKVCSRCMESV